MEAIRSRGYIQELPAWLTTDASILSKDELSSTLSLLYYFINQMERVQESDNKLSLSPKEQDELLEVGGFGLEDIDVQSRLSRLNADREHLLHNQSVLVDQLQRAKHDGAVALQRLMSSEAAWKDATKQITQERDLYRRQVADYKQRETQFQHEIRRLELDGEALREKLRNALSSGAKFSKPAISSLPEGFSKPTPVATTSSSNAAQTTTRAETTTQRTMKSRLDDLERENEQLRLLLATMTDQVDELLGSSSGGSKNASQEQTRKSDISALHALIKRQMDELRSQTPIFRTDDADSEVYNLKMQLAECQRLIEEQHKLLTLAVNPEPNRLFIPSQSQAE